MSSDFDFTKTLMDIQTVGEVCRSNPSTPIVCIFVTRSATELELLKAYVQKSPLFKENGAPAPKCAWVRFNDNGDKMSHEGLAEVLQENENPLLAPIGVTWMPKPRDEEKAPSIIDILMYERLLKNNKRQRSILRRNPHRCCIVNGEPALKSDLTKRFQRNAEMSGITSSLADYVAQQAALTVERDSRAVTGASIKMPRFVASAVWARTDFQERLKEIAQESGRSMADVEEEAKRCINELIPRTDPFYVSLLHAFFRFIRRLGYEDKMVYDRSQLRHVRDGAFKKPTALLFTHKSHIDGIALLDIAHEQSFPQVHIIGGNNLAFFGLGYLLRRAGGVFIRRDSSGDAVYKAVLRFYLSYLLEKRFPIAWSFEGTRSRNGKLMPPRFGILKYVIEAAAKNSIQDLQLVPVSIYYDLIAELNDYAYEQRGGVKRPETIAWFAKYISTLQKPLGRVSLAFCNPVVVDASDDKYVSGKSSEDDSFSLELQKLSFQVSVNANQKTPITPSGVMALVLSGAAPQALTEVEIHDETNQILQWARERNLPMTNDLRDKDTERSTAISKAMIDIGVMSEYNEGSETVYGLEQSQQYFATGYYRNSIIHFFIDKAMLELALLKASETAPEHALEIFNRDLMSIRDLFKHEFFYPPSDQHKANLYQEMARYDSNWEDVIKNGGAHEFLTAMPPLVSHAALRSFTEAYTVIGDVLVRLKNGDDDSEKAVVAAALRYGKQAYLRRRLTSPESIGKQMFVTGYQLAKHRGLLNAPLAARVEFVRELKDIARRIRIIDAICAQRRAQNEAYLENVPMEEQGHVYNPSVPSFLQPPSAIKSTQTH